MKSFIVLCVILATAFAAPPPPAETETKPPVLILRSEFVKEADGSYHYSYENSDGSSRDERGILINPGEENEGVAVEGVYSYIDSEGEKIQVNYKADDHGFVPEGGKIDPVISQGARAASESNAREGKKV